MYSKAVISGVPRHTRLPREGARGAAKLWISLKYASIPCKIVNKFLVGCLKWFFHVFRVPPNLFCQKKLKNCSKECFDPNQKLKFFFQRKRSWWAKLWLKSLIKKTIKNLSQWLDFTDKWLRPFSLLRHLFNILSDPQIYNDLF